MALTDFTNRANTTLLAAEVQEIRDHLQGAALSTEAWHFRCSTGNNFLITLADASGARKFSVRDSAGVEQFSVDSDGVVSLTSATFTGTLIVPTAASPSQTTDGQVVWDSDDNLLTIGDGASRKTFYPGQATWEHIDTQILTGTAASVSFSSLSSDYKLFRLTMSVTNTLALVTWIRLNNDSGTNYEYQYIQATGATLDAARATGQAQCITTTTGVLENGLIEVIIQKEVAGQEASILSSCSFRSAANTPRLAYVGGAWLNTADLINRIDAVASTSTFAADSRFTLEGMKVTT